MIADEIFWWLMVAVLVLGQLFPDGVRPVRPPKKRRAAFWRGTGKVLEIWPAPRRKKPWE